MTMNGKKNTPVTVRFVYKPRMTKLFK